VRPEREELVFKMWLFPFHRERENGSESWTDYRFLRRILVISRSDLNGTLSPFTAAPMPALGREPSERQTKRSKKSTI
jgi:hypothetical protein